MRAFLSFLVGLLVLVAFSFALPAPDRADYPYPLGPSLAPAIRDSYRQEIEARHPQVVLLGDSMLQRGVDEAALTQALGAPAYRLAEQGSASVIWYLIIKNSITQTEYSPRLVVVLFRDSILTAPAYRVTGPYFAQVDENASADDTLLLQYAYIDPLGPVERLAEQYLPLYRQRVLIRKAIDSRLRNVLPGLALGCDPGCVAAAMDNIFDANNMEAGILGDAAATAESYLYAPERLDFAARVERSFLPEMIRLTREHGIRLVLVRFKTLAFAEGAEPRGLPTYMEDLRSYLAENDVTLIDYSADPRLTSDLYFDAFHLTAEGQAVFTLILAGDLKPLLEETP